MELNERIFNILIIVTIILFISSVVLAALQRYVAAVFAILSGLVLISFVSEIRSEGK